MRKDKIDPISLEIVKNALQSIAEEMGASLIKAAYSTNIKDRRDCSCAIYTRSGELVAQAEHIPVHLGVMANVVKRVLQNQSLELNKGDAVIHNDPYQGGSHLSDIMMFSPVFHGDEMVGIVGNLAHHVDVGGMDPGSMPPLAVEHFQEGLRIPPCKIRENGKLVQSILDIIKANIRTPNITEKDLLAQTAANLVGQKRFSELAKKYGPEMTVAFMEAILDYSERMMRARITELPDGKSYFEDFIEGDGFHDAPIKVCATVEIRDDEIYVDFTGTSPQVKSSINSVDSVTLASVYYVIKSVLDPEIPSNSGAYRPIHVTAPEGTVVNAKFPAACSTMNGITAMRIADVLYGALGAMVPERITAASAGVIHGIGIGGVDPRSGQYYYYMEAIGGGQGAKYNQDGMNGVQTNMTNTRNAPTEVIEASYPLRVDHYGLVKDSAGAGTFRGGLGLTREVTVLGHTGTFSVVADRMLTGPWGFDGGGPGGKAEYLIIKASGQAVKLPSMGTFEAEPGDKIIVRTSGGGGYGNPLQRNFESIKRDLREGYVSQEEAVKSYKVTIQDGELKKIV